MGIKDCKEIISQFPMDKVFTSCDVADDNNIHAYLRRLCDDGFIAKLPDKVRIGRNSQCQYRRVAYVENPFEPWKQIWPEFFTMPRFTGVRHRYVQEL